MFDVGASELLVIGVVALVVIGPKELPGVIRTLGQSVAKLRRMAGDFRQQFDEAMREADLDGVQKSMSETADLAKSAVTGFNPIETIRNEIRSTVDEIKGAGRDMEASISKPADITPPVVNLEPPVEFQPAMSLEPASLEPVVERLEPVDDEPPKAKRAPRKKKTGDEA